MGPTWGPSGSCRPQMGPMLAPWALLSGNVFNIIKRGRKHTVSNIIGIIVPADGLVSAVASTFAGTMLIIGFVQKQTLVHMNCTTNLADFIRIYWAMKKANTSGTNILRCFDVLSRFGLSYQMLSLFNTLRPRQNGRHFPDAISKCIFLNENAWIPTETSLKFVPNGPINNIPAQVQIIAWRRYLNQWWLVYRLIYVPLGLNESMGYVRVSFQ